MAWQPKVNRHVHVESAGDTKLKPGTITAVAGNLITARITHTGQVVSNLQQVKPKSSRVT